MTSVYRWDGEISEEEEQQIVQRTTTEQAQRDLGEQWDLELPGDGELASEGPDGEAVAARSLRWQAARIAALCLAGALIIPTLLPHLPTRYVLDGLGAGGAGSARSTDGIRLSSELDLRRSLQSPSEEPVLRYTTTTASSTSS